ncbi:MAG TPA: hypothetical protein PK760_00855, partial [Flavobacteriales bacterium]|nr:hypothetical protein [Flavobacteriales bacterium]
VGLRPLDVDEGLLFFGRQGQVTDLLQGLHEHRFVGVVGGSGSGKSSLLRAGVIPTLKAGYLVQDSDHWLIAIMKPGQNPLFNFTSAIVQQVDPRATAASIDAHVQGVMEGGAQVLLDLIRPLREKNSSNFFLLVDQFEELFRFATIQHGGKGHADEAIDFVNIILELSQQTEVPFHVVLTMRSDFIGDCAQFFGLPEALNKSQYLVPRMNRVQLKQAIEGPAILHGTRVDQPLLSRLLNEVGRFRDELPVLQHALLRMWDHEQRVDGSGALDLQDLGSIGGLDKALSQHADEALEGMEPKERQLSKSMFQALTEIDDHGRKIRRPVLFSELQELTGATAQGIMHVVQQFVRDGRSFLVLSPTADGKDQVLDISHESLIRQWDQLGEWVDEEGESAAMYGRLAEAAHLHALGKGDLLAGTALHSMLEWRNSFRPSAIWAKRYGSGFEGVMVYLNESGAAEEQLRRKERAARTRLRVLVASIMGLLLIIAVGGFVLLRRTQKQKELADRAKQEAEAATKNALAETDKTARALEQANENLEKFHRAERAKLILELEALQKKGLVIMKVNGCPREIIEKMKGILETFGQAGHQDEEAAEWTERVTALETYCP